MTAAAIKRPLPLPKIFKELKLPLKPDCFYRVTSFTKSIDVRPSSTALKDLKAERVITYYNADNPDEVQKCKVLFVKTYPSFESFAGSENDQIPLLYPGITQAAIAQKLYESTMKEPGEVVAIHFEIKSVLRFEPISPPVGAEPPAKFPKHQPVSQDELWIAVRKPPGARGKDEGCSSSKSTDGQSG